MSGVEARVPLDGLLRRLRLALFPVEAAAFADGGLAWSDRVCTAATLPYAACPAGETRPITVALRARGADPYFVRTPAFSWGLGLRTNLGFGVLRLDYALPLDRPRRAGVWSFAIGPAF